MLQWDAVTKRRKAKTENVHINIERNEYRLCFSEFSYRCCKHNPLCHWSQIFLWLWKVFSAFTFKPICNSSLRLKKVKVAQLCPLPLCDPKNYKVHGILWARILFSLSLLQGIFLTQGSKGIEPRSSALQVDSLSAEPQGKPKNKWSG